ncbi:MAG: dihydrolipoyl dehydrogenase [Thermoguttaceae bacterium]
MDDKPLQFDVAIIGGGPGGEAAAVRAVLRGARVCLIEAGNIGGTCLNVGCMPTKTLLAASALFHQTKNTLPAETVFEPDGKAVMQRVAKVVGGLLEAATKKLETKKNLTIIRGSGRLTGKDTLLVDTADGRRAVGAKSIIIATGAEPLRPDFLPWDSPRLMTSDEAVRMSDLPQSIIVLGGGVIGCEFATAYAEFGIPVTVVEMLDELLDGFEKEASEAVARSLADRGATVLLGRKIVRIGAHDSAIEAETDDGRIITAAHALVAVGRRARIEGLGLEEAGVETAEGIIPVDRFCRTNVANIYAAGDVAEKQQYAHLAARMGVVAAENATGHELAEDRRIVPTGAYTHPEIASVGLCESEAREEASRQGIKIRVLRYSLRNSGIAICYNQTEGLVKLIVDDDAGRILGATWIGPHATDLIHEPALAMRHGLRVEQLAETIHAHPTFAESLTAAIEPWIAQAIRKQG